MDTTDNDKKVMALVIVSTLATCGLLIPVWLVVGLIVIIVKLVSPPPKINKPEVKYIPPSNDFASDWKFEIRDI